MPTLQRGTCKRALWGHSSVGRAPALHAGLSSVRVRLSPLPFGFGVEVRAALSVDPLLCTQGVRGFRLGAYTKALCMSKRTNPSVYTVYQTTCLSNGKIYIGVHKTKDPEDDYIGSGSLLRQAVLKHGRENFQKEVLFTFATSDEAYAKEREIVDESFVAREDTYNLMQGGVESPGYYRPRNNQHNTQYGKCWVFREGCGEKSIPRGDLSAHESGGWSKGRDTKNLRHKLSLHSKAISMAVSRSSSGRVFIHRPGEGLKFLPKAEAEELIASGWVRGKPQRTSPQGLVALKECGKKFWENREESTTKGRKWIHLEGKGKMVPAVDVPLWVAKGWTCGEPPHVRGLRKQQKGTASSQFGKRFAYVWKPGDPGTRKIPLDSLPTFLMEGWVRGMNPASQKKR